ncbi:MAG TPA: M56 family metallopeptidase [Puia sp.]|nr:M56 family metallopeptidase [Puia sp.]
MLLLSVQQFFDGRIIQALCWTLLHSLWQGLLLAIVGGIVILLTRKSAPAIRYNLLSALFFLFFFSAMLTFGLQLHFNAGPAGAGILVLSPQDALSGLSGGSAAQMNIVPGTGANFINSLVSYFDAHAMLVVMIWFVIFSARLVRILAHLGTIQRMRHYRTHQPSGHWRDRLEELALTLQVRIRVALLESEIVRVPMVVGFFKPVILIPFSLLSQLPPEQVEAILLHELAHIRRRDYFVNLIQSFAEILFFFNPGVLWISSLIREERENCCDDIALGQVKNKKEFIHALVNFQEYNNNEAGAGRRSVLAFAGSRYHLLQRVKRIIYRDNKMLDIRERFFLLGCLLITGALTLAFSYSPQKGNMLKADTGKTGTVAVARARQATRIVSPADGVQGDGATDMSEKSGMSRTDGLATTDKTGKALAAADDDGMQAGRDMGSFLADTTRPDTKQDALTMDSVPGPSRKEKLRREREMLAEQRRKLEDEQRSLSERQQKLMEEEIRLGMDDGDMGMEDKKAQLEMMELKARIMDENRRLGDLDRDKMSKEERIMMENKMRKLGAWNKEMAERHEEMTAKEKLMMENKLRALQAEDRKAMSGDQHVLLQDQNAMLQDQKTMAEDLNRKMKDSKRLMIEKNRDLLEQSHRNMDASRRILEENRARLEENRERMEIDREKRRKDVHDELNPIIGALSDRKLITDKNDFSFSLDQYGLTVNGVKQSDEVYQQFREKFLKDPEDRIIYSKKNGSESVTIHKK